MPVVNEALDAAAKIPGTSDAYTKAEMTDAITELFRKRDPSAVLPMLRDDFVLKVPTTLPYGGQFTGAGAFARFFTGTPGGSDVWESFTVHLDDIIEAGAYLIARLTNIAVPKKTGQAVVFQNLWLFEVADGKFTRAQLYADTAAIQPTAG